MSFGINKVIDDNVLAIMQIVWWIKNDDATQDENKLFQFAHFSSLRKPLQFASDVGAKKMFPCQVVQLCSTFLIKREKNSFK